MDGCYLAIKKDYRVYNQNVSIAYSGDDEARDVVVVTIVVFFDILSSRNVLSGTSENRVYSTLAREGG